MKFKIKFFNMEIGVFLRYLHYFSSIECVQISNQTVNLLQATIGQIVDLRNTAEVVEVTDAADVDFIFDLDEHRYELQRYIACHECNVSVIYLIFDGVFQSTHFARIFPHHFDNCFFLIHFFSGEN